MIERWCFQNLCMHYLYLFQSVYISAYNSVSGVIKSTLTLKLNKKWLPTLNGTSWWCQVEYSILDDETVLTGAGDKVVVSYKILSSK